MLSDRTIPASVYVSTPPNARWRPLMVSILLLDAASPRSQCKHCLSVSPHCPVTKFFLWRFRTSSHPNLPFSAAAPSINGTSTKVLVTGPGLHGVDVLGSSLTLGGGRASSWRVNRAWELVGLPTLLKQF